MGALLGAVCGFAGSARADEDRFLDRVRRLTFEGRRAGEGYFSPDGRRLVFQSEREPGNPFFQIYVLDLDSGEVEPISTGTGKCTCAFFRKGGREILFASTHHDPQSERWQREELERRAAGAGRRYDWDYDPEMEVYLHRPGSDLVRLTRAFGYDAEASFSPDGEWIVFASNREAWTRADDPEVRAALEHDPSRYIDLYRMRTDGSDVERLTDVPGYDGGPFFMPDGEHVVWRRFDVDGVIADVWIARADGSEARRITDFGAMSWAPYPHPSGAYLFFTSNKLGFDNFELFVVDVEGRKEPVRVTHTPGFDGLPVPSPDGRTLAWTSTRGGLDNGQLFLGRWDHEAALAALGAAPEREAPAGAEP